MRDFVSTNVRLPHEDLKALKLRAVEEGKSMGQTLREILARGLVTTPTSSIPPAEKRLGKKNPLSGVARLGTSGVRDGALNHDKYLYGKPKALWKS